MSTQRVTIKLTTLEELKRLLENGDSVTALSVINEALDQERQAKLKECKRLAYAGYRQGRWNRETYKTLFNYADSFLR